MSSIECRGRRGRIRQQADVNRFRPGLHDEVAYFCLTKPAIPRLRHGASDEKILLDSSPTVDQKNALTNDATICRPQSPRHQHHQKFCPSPGGA
jgi:hypothetical protein